MSDGENVIRVVFNADARSLDEREVGIMDALDKCVMGFIGDPPDTEFQLGYLWCAVQMLKDFGGDDYMEFAAQCSSRLPK